MGLRVYIDRNDRHSDGHKEYDDLNPADVSRSADTIAFNLYDSGTEPQAQADKKMSGAGDSTTVRFDHIYLTPNGADSCAVRNQSHFLLF